MDLFEFLKNVKISQDFSPNLLNSLQNANLSKCKCNKMSKTDKMQTRQNANPTKCKCNKMQMGQIANVTKCK